MNVVADRPPNVGALRDVVHGASANVEAATKLQGLADDSRNVVPGDAFFARRGSLEDGAQYAIDAVERGAVVVVSDTELPGLPTLLVKDVDTALRLAADAWYGRPQDVLDLIGITGTKGKTTAAHLTAAALRACGRPAALLGTIAHDLGDGDPIPAGNTTPGALELRRLLARARDAGCTAAVMEVSSHALDQSRTEGLEYRVAIFTNLASDHLDYHGSPDAYFEAKAKLFSELPPSGIAVLNREDGAWTRLAARCRGSVLTYGTSAESDLRATDVTLGVEGTTFRLVVADDGHVDAQTPLTGRHNVMNLLAAVGGCVGLGIDPIVAVEGACSLAGVPGRLQRVTSSDDLHVFVDYAHTEDALRQVLAFLADVGAEPLICVVGCGGDRDAFKRPRMGRVAAEASTRAYFTSDNPRSEDPEQILDQMMSELRAEDAPSGLTERVVRVVDRREAIRRAVLDAPDGATVLVAGKGHETYQVLGTEKVPFDDVEEVRAALEERAARDPSWGAPQA